MAKFTVVVNLSALTALDAAIAKAANDDLVSRGVDRTDLKYDTFYQKEAGKLMELAQRFVAFGKATLEFDGTEKTVTVLSVKETEKRTKAAAKAEELRLKKLKKEAERKAKEEAKAKKKEPVAPVGTSISDFAPDIDEDEVG